MIRTNRIQIGKNYWDLETWRKSKKKPLPKKLRLKQIFLFGVCPKIEGKVVHLPFGPSRLEQPIFFKFVFLTFKFLIKK